MDVDNEIPHDLLQPPEAPQDQPPPSDPLQRRAVEVEEVLDEDSPDHRWVEDYPGPAGSVYGRSQGTFEKYREKQEERGDPPWYPFESEAEWELARWLMTSGVSQSKIDSFLVRQMHVPSEAV
ncbi:hypothetical protein LshimejAT787_2200310 [Lyophyllum shimeji]|uniref:Uncharacterized protein n=1 Tax=Lyophyllum shimeji TaxID=47721 RepID=A0A9P3UU90_LYOSH|nr:hypothetical protein LshimejAT787_2200310 [Lyophyllum shimeji]